MSSKNAQRLRIATLALLAGCLWLALAVSAKGADLPLALPHDRSAVVQHKNGTMLDLGAHTENPFPSEQACLAGIEDDTAAVGMWLIMQGVDIADVKIVVTCAPAGRNAGAPT